MSFLKVMGRDFQGKNAQIRFKKYDCLTHHDDNRNESGECVCEGCIVLFHVNNAPHYKNDVQKKEKALEPIWMTHFILHSFV